VHEVGLLTRAIAEAVATAERAGARRIVRLTFAIAPGGHVSAERVATMVPVLAAGTLAEGAVVAVELQGTVQVCWGCGRAYAIAAGEATCPACGCVPLPTGQAPDVALVSIDVAE
jgi:Zn finger protein HypA/HybF involved in hydrogenase expression